MNNEVHSLCLKHKAEPLTGTFVKSYLTSKEITVNLDGDKFLIIIEKLMEFFAVCKFADRKAENIVVGYFATR